MPLINAGKAQELCNRLFLLTIDTASFADRLIKARQILEQLYKAVTENSVVSFNGLFARMQYANEQHRVSSELQSKSNYIRILCNKIAHEEVNDVTDKDFHTAVDTLHQLLSTFCPELADTRIADYLQGKEITTRLYQSAAPKQSFACVVNAWAVKDNSLEIEVVREDGSFCVIRLNNDSSDKEHNGKTWTMLSKTLWRYASLMCHNLTQISGKSDSFMSNPLSLIVLEPDFLIDTSSLASCFSSYHGDPAVFILNHLLSDTSTEAMLQGSLVNSIFDELVFNPQADYLQLFRSGLASMPVAMVSLGLDAAKRIYQRIKEEHLPQLKNYAGNLKESEIFLEPSYICPDYGLQGRLDLLAKLDNQYTIVELKSGKAPVSDVWKAHQMQAIAYNMIIRNAYGTARTSNTSIFYSQSKDNPYRHVSNLTILEQDLLMCRNRILGVMHQLSEKPEQFLNWLKSCVPPEGNSIVLAKYTRYKALCGKLSDYEWEWFTTCVMLAVREIWFVKTGDNGNKSESSLGHNALWQQGKAEKLLSYKILLDLSPHSHDKNQIVFTLPPTEEIADFREGDIVVLYQQDISVTRQEILRGVIRHIDQQELRLSIRGGLMNNKRLSDGSLWAIEHDTLETSLYSPLSSVLQFLNSPSDVRSLYLGLRLPVFGTMVESKNSSDIAEIVAAMLLAKELFIVQGPPGTGKTSGLLGSYISELYHQGRKNILILSFTNRAVDEICLCLLRKGIPFLRSGSSSIITDDLLSKRIEGKRFEEIHELITQNRIWVSTVQSANAWFGDMQKLISFDEIIVDEASQIIESSILGIISQVPKTILVGDQNQLPPIVTQSPVPFAFEHPTLIGLGYSSYGQSLMERLHGLYSRHSHISSLAMLIKHYRMHSSIAELIGNYYQNRLITGSLSQEGPLESIDGMPDFLAKRLIWINCPPSEIMHYDLAQVQLIKSLLATLTNTIDCNVTAIGIVAPFRAMIHALRKELPPEFKDITIDTVERFQGSERDTIILCLPLSHANNLCQIQSLNDEGSIDRKLNVAISRAKQRIIIIANLGICSDSPHYAKLIDKIRLNGNVVDIAVAQQQLAAN